jgi:hypothetical protein
LHRGLDRIDDGDAALEQFARRIGAGRKVSGVERANRWT